MGSKNNVCRIAVLFLYSALLVSCGPKSSEKGDRRIDDAFFLLETTVAELTESMERGELSSEEIVERYLDRIEAIDRSGPKLNSIIELNPDALKIAQALDDERAQGHIRGPLHGIPILIKDNIDTADRMMTTAGATALVGNYAAEDAFLVQRLRENGAVILGKTNLSEWANFRSSRSSSGWSSRGGQTRNPYFLDRNPCGSSSGSGAAVSANLCPIAIGTETNGSIICPSSANGIVGIKPTVGLISRSGIIPISSTQDTAGPMARTVADAALLLGALTGQDPDDSPTLESAGHALLDYTPFLRKDGLAGKRIGVWRSKFGKHEGVHAVMELALTKMQAAGATLVDLDTIAEEEPSLQESPFLVMKYEFKKGLNAYLAKASPPTGVRSLEDVIAYNLDHSEETQPYFLMEILEASEAISDLDTEAYLKAKELVQSRYREGINQTMDAHRLDAIVAPSGGPAWCTDLVNGDHFSLGSSSPAARAGYPNISVPAGYVHGLPIGISFFGRAWSEGTLIEIAYSFEQTTQVRMPPRFLPTLSN